MLCRILRVVIMTVIAILLVSGAFLGGFATSRQVFPPARPPDGGAPADWKPVFPVFWEAWNYIHQDYYKTPLDTDGLVYGSIRGMVDALGDENTTFLDAQQAARMRADMAGSFEGIGATVEMREGRLYIVAPIKGSPAEKAGLLPNDIVLQVDDTIIQNMDINQAVSLIRGPKGTTVTLKIQRSKQPPFTVSIVRATIRTPYVEARMIEDKRIAYIRMTTFGATAPDELEAALREAMAQRPIGLIFDLRRNLGGYLPVTIDIASQFLKGGQTVVVVKGKSGSPTVEKARAGGLAPDIPMVLLVDEFSASASEIIAAALKDHQRAILVGVKTFGKGSVQVSRELKDQSVLNVTVAYFFSPKDNQIDDVGVTPDIEVKITEDDLAQRRDPQLEKAIELLTR